MMSVTVEDVVGDIKIFQQFSESHVIDVIKDSLLQATNDGINDTLYPDIYDRAVKRYARHLLVVDDFMNYGGVTSAESLGQNQTITDKTNSDVYLKQYLDDVKNYGIDKSKGSATFE